MSKIVELNIATDVSGCEACWYARSSSNIFRGHRWRTTHPAKVPGVFSIKLTERRDGPRRHGFQDAVKLKRALKRELGISRKLGH